MYVESQVTSVYLSIKSCVNYLFANYYSCSFTHFLQVHHGGAGTTAAGLKAAVRN